MATGQSGPYDHRAFLNAALRTDASPETLSALIVKLQLAANDINESLDHSSDALMAAVPKYCGGAPCFKLCLAFFCVVAP
jgi:hypothetical protein